MHIGAWPYVQTKIKKNFKPRARINNHTDRSFALTCPYMRAHTCMAVLAKKKKLDISTLKPLA